MIRTRRKEKAKKVSVLEHRQAGRNTPSFKKKVTANSHTDDEGYKRWD